MTHRLVFNFVNRRGQHAGQPCGGGGGTAVFVVTLQFVPQGPSIVHELVAHWLFPLQVFETLQVFVVQLLNEPHEFQSHVFACAHLFVVHEFPLVAHPVKSLLVPHWLYVHVSAGQVFVVHRFCVHESAPQVFGRQRFKEHGDSAVPQFLGAQITAGLFEANNPAARIAVKKSTATDSLIAGASHCTFQHVTDAVVH